MERPGCSIPDAAETTPVRDPLLHPRSRRLSDRSRANHGPTGGLVARSLAIEYAGRGVWVSAEIASEIPTSTVASPPDTEPRSTGYSARSGPEMRAGFQRPPLSSMPVEYLTPAIEDRAV